MVYSKKSNSNFVESESFLNSIEYSEFNGDNLIFI